MKSHFYKLYPFFQKRVCLLIVYILFVKLECSTVILNGLNDFSYAEEIEIEDLWNWYVFDFSFSK